MKIVWGLVIGISILHYAVMGYAGDYPSREAENLMSWAFALLQLAALSRVALAAFAVSGLWLAALCWCLAFGLFLRHYAAMFCSARVDGHPG